MNGILKIFHRKKKTLCQVTNVKVSKSDMTEEWNVEISHRDQLLIDGVKNRSSIISTRKSQNASQESLNSIGVAYLRHPDDKKSKFSRPNSLSTSTAIYGRYSMCSLDQIDFYDTPVDKQSLESLERIESLQKRSFDIAKRRRQNLRNKENKKRRLLADDEIPRKVKAQSMIELGTSDLNYDHVDVLTIEMRQEPPIVTRNSSLQKKSWEIRRERKMKMKKRRSQGYQSEYCPLLEIT